MLWKGIRKQENNLLTYVREDWFNTEGFQAAVDFLPVQDNADPFLIALNIVCFESAILGEILHNAA